MNADGEVCVGSHLVCVPGLGGDGCGPMGSLDEYGWGVLNTKFAKEHKGREDYFAIFASGFSLAGFALNWIGV